MRVVAVCLAGSLLFNPALVRSSDFEQKANDEEKYSASLVVVPLAKSPKYLKYQDGRQQVIYSTESEYPAEAVLSFISAELKKRGWKPLPQDFFNPDIPSSHRRGWTFFEDHTQEPWTGVYAWNADWENGSHDIVVYVLRYESPDNSTRNLKNLQVIELFIPSDIAAKMRRDAVNAKDERKGMVIVRVFRDSSSSFSRELDSKLYSLMHVKSGKKVFIATMEGNYKDELAKLTLFKPQMIILNSSADAQLLAWIIHDFAGGKRKGALKD
jgi:hypothetical protein